MSGKDMYRDVFNKISVIFLCVVAAFCLQPSLAHGQVVQQGSGAGSPEFALRKLQTEDNPDWKVIWDKRTEAAKRLFNARSRVFPGKPQDAAREFLSQYHGLFGLNPGLNNLQTEECMKTPLGERVTFRQYHNHLPVMGAGVTVHVSDKNNIFFVENRNIPNIQTDTQPDVKKDDAVSAAEKALAVDASIVEKVSAELVVLPCGCEQKLAWRLIVSKKGLIDRTWLVYVDAKRKGWVLYKKKLQSSAAGTGSVYKENPITTPFLTTVALNNLTDNSPSLEGAYGRSYNAKCVYTVNDTSNLSGLSTAFSPDRNYRYTGSDTEMEEVMAYYHVNNMHDMLKSSFGFGGLDKQIPMFVNVQDQDDPSTGYDNAFYSRDDNFASTGYVLFGCGNELHNLGLDADVITHEYGHAVLDHIQPDLYEVVEHNYSGAIHESTGDVMASYFNGNGIIGEWGLTAKDGANYTRDMDNTRKYPEDVYDPSSEPKMSEVHYTGEILNGVYWDIKDAVGTDIAFQLFFSAINLLPNDADFFDMRDAWMTADGGLRKGADADAIEAAFANHGIEGDDPGNTKATLKLNSLIFKKYDPDTGIAKKQKIFRRGDEILVYAKATISNLTPAYNLIPDVSVSGNGAKTFQGESYYTEALEGVNEYQIAYLTSDSATGKIKVKAEARMGGTDKVAVKTGTFTIK